MKSLKATWYRLFGRGDFQEDPDVKELAERLQLDSKERRVVAPTEGWSFDSLYPFHFPREPEGRYCESGREVMIGYSFEGDEAIAWLPQTWHLPQRDPIDPEHRKLIKSRVIDAERLLRFPRADWKVPMRFEDDRESET